MPTPHIGAQKGEIAETVLLPGDPLRAKFIAENYLEDAVLVSDVRNMYVYTGTYKNKKISVMGTGMGIPSMSIAANELINEYGSKNLIRIGSFGAYTKDIDLGDILIINSASTDSNVAHTYGITTQTLSGYATFDLLFKSVNVARENDIKYHVGAVLTSDVFYAGQQTEDDFKMWLDLGHVGVEMETYGLYIIGAHKGINVLSIVTCSDNFETKELMTSEQRQLSFDKMINLALETTDNM